MPPVEISAGGFLMQHLPFTPGDDRGWQDVRQVDEGGKDDITEREIAGGIGHICEKLDLEGKDQDIEQGNNSEEGIGRS